MNFDFVGQSNVFKRTKKYQVHSFFIRFESGIDVQTKMLNSIILTILFVSTAVSKTKL